MDSLSNDGLFFPPLTHGTVLSMRYEIIDTIGQGGCGRVYRGKDRKLIGKIWAIKEIYTSADEFNTEFTHAKEAFNREVTMLSALKHPLIPQIIDYFYNMSNYYIVMDYIEGKTLDETYKSMGKLWNNEEIITLALEICEVLEYLHCHSVIFRDLKPQNIIINEQGKPVLIDFGIARHFKPGQTKDTINIGTVGYAAPEQYGKKGGGSDRRTDIYALGVIMNYLATGEDPLEKEEPFKFSTVRGVNINISKDLEKIINKCLQFNKDDRFPNVKELEKALGEIPLKESRNSFSLQKIHSDFYMEPAEKNTSLLITNQKKNKAISYRDKISHQYAVPHGSKIKIEKTINNTYIIDIPGTGISGEMFVALFMLVWLSGWTFGGAMAITGLIKTFNLFLLFWLCGWALGEFFASFTLLSIITHMFGKSIITIEKEYMKIKVLWLGFIPVEKTYEINKIKHLNIKVQD